MTTALEVGEVSASRPGRSLHPGKPGNHWALGLVWTCAENQIHGSDIPDIKQLQKTIRLSAAF
jgi:hypothetical protein